MRGRRAVRFALAAGLAAAALTGCGAERATAPWPPLAPLDATTGPAWRGQALGMGRELNLDSPNECARGTPLCMDAILNEMTARLERQAARCDHGAPFALMYRQVTHEVSRSVRAEAYREPGYVAHLDAAFATLYFRAADAWRAGRRAEVPRAWRLAFAAAARRELPAIGNMLLGMNAHISRDLPYALAGVGLRLPDGRDATPDAVAVNRDISRAQEPMLRDVAARFDPSVNELQRAGRLFDPRQLDRVIAEWRLEAIRNARRLLAARTAAERRGADIVIDANATTRALLIWRATRFEDPARERAPRDVYCAAHG